jgi:acyl-ACP thioesterase
MFNFGAIMSALNPNIPFKRSFPISSFDVDAKKQASMQAISRYLQEIATLHADELQFGFHDMIKQGRGWLLAQMKIRVDRFPKIHEMIHVSTWSNGVDGRYATRDFRIKDDEGEVIAVASSSWFVVDIADKKICRLDEYFDPEDFTRIDWAIGGKPGRVRSFTDPDQETEVTARYSDLDINGHMNNVKYLELILDMFKTDFRLSRDIYEIEMNFLKETVEGDVLGNMLKVLDPGKEYLHCLFNKSTKKPSFTASTSWR